MYMHKYGYITKKPIEVSVYYSANKVIEFINQNLFFLSLLFFVYRTFSGVVS